MARLTMRWDALPDAKPRLLPFPKSLARQKTERAARKRYGQYKWARSLLDDWETVQLALVPGRGWMLAYRGEPRTGPFKTRRDAMGWYLRSGR